MSNTADCLYKASFPEVYADILIETLAITPANFLSIKDALYHFRHVDDNQAAETMQHIAEHVETNEAEEATPADIHELLAERRQIAMIWSTEDVQGIRPDLSDDQCWEVLQSVDHHKDAELGITWLTLELAAEDLFGSAPGTDAAEEA
jgi:hypothetical protein